MDCPKCRTPTLHRTAEAASGLRLDRCSTCEGSWLDYGELAPAAQRQAPGLPPPPLDPANDARTGPCPRCAVPLQQTLSPDGTFHVERCTRCGGLFLDRGELAAIAAKHLVDDLERVLATRIVPEALATKPPPPVDTAKLSHEDRVLLARAVELAARHPEAAAFLRDHLDGKARLRGS